MYAVQYGKLQLLASVLLSMLGIAHCMDFILEFTHSHAALPCSLVPGFGSYLLGLNTVGYELTGGASTPGNVGIVDSTSPKNIIGFGLCIIFIGAHSLLLRLPSSHLLFC